MGSRHSGDSDVRDWQIIGEMATGLFDKIKQNRDEADFNTYSAEFGKNPEFNPNYDDPAFNAKAFSKAKANFVNMQIQDENIKKVRYETWKQDIDKKMVAAHETFAKGMSFIDKDNLEEGLPWFEKAFEQVNTGTDIRIGEDKKSFVEVNNLTGEETPHHFKSTRDMVNMFQTYAQGLRDPKAFAQNHIMSSEQATAHNIQAISNAVEVFNKQGKRALLVKGLVDPDTGKPQGDMIDTGGGNYVPAGDESVSDFRTRKSTSDEAKEEETRAGIAEKYAGAFEKRQQGLSHGKTVAEKNLSPEQKLAKGIASVFDVSEKEALDYVLTNKTTDDKLSIVAKMLKDDEDLTVDSPVVQQRIKELGLEAVFSKEPVSEQIKKKGKGVNPQSQAKADDAAKIDAKYPATAHKGKSATINGVKYISNGTEWKKAK